MVARADGGPDQRPLLIVVSSLGQSSREYFFQSVSSRYRLWSFVGGAGRPNEATWELPYIVGHTVVDTLDADAMLVAARRLAETTRIAGVVCYDEARIHATATLATALGLPTSPPEAVARCRDKHLTRQALALAGVPQARSVAVRSAVEALGVAGRFGYPVVLKPRNLAASFGVRRVDSPDEMADAYAFARAMELPEAPEHYEDGVLVEEYLDGPEISVDAACFAGRVEPIVVAHKETGYPPCFEETGHLVDAADPLFTDERLHRVVAAAHAAVGYHTGMTHTELRLTGDGPKIIEINARLGGDMIPYLGQLATGVDPSLAGAAIACGEVPDLTRTRQRVAGLRFYYPERDITVRSIGFDTSLLPAEVERAVPLTGPGLPVRLPPGGSAWESRLAQVVAVADTETACRAALDAAGKALVVEAEEDRA